MHIVLYFTSNIDVASKPPADGGAMWGPRGPGGPGGRYSAETKDRWSQAVSPPRLHGREEPSAVRGARVAAHAFAVRGRDGSLG